jgi:hypothetical protein
LGMIGTRSAGVSTIVNSNGVGYFSDRLGAAKSVSTARCLELGRFILKYLNANSSVRKSVSALLNRVGATGPSVMLGGMYLAENDVIVAEPVLAIILLNHIRPLVGLTVDVSDQLNGFDLLMNLVRESGTQLINDQFLIRAPVNSIGASGMLQFLAGTVKQFQPVTSLNEVVDESEWCRYWPIGFGQMMLDAIYLSSSPKTQVNNRNEITRKFFRGLISVDDLKQVQIKNCYRAKWLATEPQLINPKGDFLLRSGFEQKGDPPLYADLAVQLKKLVDTPISNNDAMKFVAVSGIDLVSVFEMKSAQSIYAWRNTPTHNADLKQMVVDYLTGIGDDNVTLKHHLDAIASHGTLVSAGVDSERNRQVIATGDDSKNKGATEYLAIADVASITTLLADIYQPVISPTEDRFMLEPIPLGMLQTMTFGGKRGR